MCEKCGCQDDVKSYISVPSNDGTAVGYQVLGITAIGVNAFIPDPNGVGNVYNDITVYNTTDHDLFVKFRNLESKVVSMLVPRYNSYRTNIGTSRIINNTVVMSSIDGEPPNWHKVIINVGTIEYVKNIENIR